ncbi:hypothetical protein ACA910_013460 [Epithemia clementina (nom. ined.)]
MGHDDDLISFAMSCLNVVESGKEGAVTSECPSTVTTIDVWHIHGNQLIVHGHYVEGGELSLENDSKDKTIAYVNDFFKFGQED